MSNRIKKTEHAGAKNGGGFWGTREEAKDLSRVQRRSDDKSAVDEGLTDVEDDFKPRCWKDLLFYVLKNGL